MPLGLGPGKGTSVVQRGGGQEVINRKMGLITRMIFFIPSPDWLKHLGMQSPASQ